MISDIFGHLLTWQFVIGLIAGFALHRFYAHVKAWWRNRHQPLPNGRKHQAEGVDARRLGSVIAIGVIVYSLVQVQTTAHRTDTVVDDARAFAVQVQECQQRLIVAIGVNRALAAENDELSQIQRTALADWLHDLLFPPQVVIDLGRQGPAYNKWALDLTQHYYGIIADAQHKQDDNNRERAAHPLPPPTCGR